MPKKIDPRVCLAIVGLIGTVAAWSPSVASAAGAPTGITLSPFEENVTIQPTDATKTFNLTLSNRTTVSHEIDLKAQDFGSLNDSGGVLLEGSNSYTAHYGLIAWLSLGANQVSLRPGESRTVPITIYNRSSLQPGGHYGAVVASIDSSNSPGGNHVAVNQRLLSLILLDKAGGEHFDLRLASVQQNGNWLHLPNDITLRFQNPGNVHVIPRGLVKLISPGGTVVAQGIINQESAFILPGSFRQMYVPLTPVAKAPPLPGIYHLAVSYRYDGISQYATKTYLVSFVDLGLYVVFAAIILVGSWLFFWRKKSAKNITSR